MPPNTIPKYKTTQDHIQSQSQLPVPLQERLPTDIFCTIITAIFAIAMFVLACIVFDGSKLGYITYPTDNQGRTCTLQSPTYNYLYFTSITDPTKRVCVSECPKGTEDKLQCLPTDEIGCSKNANPSFEVQIYASELEDTSLGLFCFPQDESVKSELLKNSNLQQKFAFVKSYRSIWISAGVAFGLSILFLALTWFATRVMVYVSIVLGGICFIFAAVIMIIMSARQFLFYTPIVYILAVIFIIFGVMLLFSLFFKSKDINLCSNYLQLGFKVLSKQKSLLLLIPIFIALSIGLTALCWFQLLSYWSHSNLQFHQQDVYYQPQGIFASIMQVLDLIEFIWGLCFLKEAYNFIVSGCAVTYVYLGQSYIMHGIKGLFRYHWGSVAASSFLLNFFYLPDIIYDFFKPSQGRRTLYKCFTSVCCLCDRLFGFARSQTMSFINAVGLPYCNSSRWCQKINYLSNYFDGSQSIFRYFSLGSHVMLATLGTTIGFLYSTATGNVPNQSSLIFSFGLNLFVVTFFVSLIKNLGESNLMCIMINKYLKGEDMHDDLNQSDSSDRNDSKMRTRRGQGLEESQVNEGYDVYPTTK